MATQQKKSAFEEALNWVGSKASDAANAVGQVASRPAQSFQNFYKDFSRGYDQFSQNQQRAQQQRVSLQAKQANDFSNQVRAGLNNVTNTVGQGVSRVVRSPITQTVGTNLKNAAGALLMGAGEAFSDRDFIEAATSKDKTATIKKQEDDRQKLYKDISKRIPDLFTKDAKGNLQLDPLKMGVSVTKGVGTVLNPVSTAVGGVLNIPFKGVENVMQGKGFLDQNLEKTIAEGIDFASLAGPLSEATGYALKPLTKLFNPVAIQDINQYLNLAKNDVAKKIAEKGLSGVPDITKEIIGNKYVQLATKRIIQNITAKGIEGGAGMGLYGAALPAKDLQERFHNIVSNAVQGAIFSAGMEGVGLGAQGIYGQAVKPLLGKPNDYAAPAEITNPLAQTNQLANEPAVQTPPEVIQKPQETPGPGITSPEDLTLAKKMLDQYRNKPVEEGGLSKGTISLLDEITAKKEGGIPNTENKPIDREQFKKSLAEIDKKKEVFTFAYEDALKAGDQKKANNILSEINFLDQQKNIISSFTQTEEDKLSQLFGGNFVQGKANEPSTIGVNNEPTLDTLQAPSNQELAMKALQDSRAPKVEQPTTPAESTPFTPSKDWQQVPEGTVVPPGGEYRMNPNAGTAEARWNEPPADPSTIAGQVQEKSIKESVTPPTGDVNKRGFVETVQNDTTSPQSIKDNIGNVEDAYYQSITNKDTMKKAVKEVVNNYDQTYKQIMDESNLNIDKDPALFIAKALVLSKKAIAEGDNALAEEIIIKAAEKGTKLGQGVQAFSLWNKTTPEGVLKFAIQEANRANEKMKNSTSRQLANKWFGRNKEKIEISPATRDEIISRMKAIQTMPDGPDKVEALRQVMDVIGKELPPTFSELFDAYRYQNILSNPLTHLRNTFGNSVQFAVIRPATLLAEAGIDAAHSLVDPSYQREAKFSDVPRYLWNGISSFQTASEAFMTRLMGQGAINQPDLHSIRSTNIPRYLKVLPNLLEGSDAFFSTLVSSGEKAVLESHGMDSAKAATRANEMTSRLLFRNDIDPFNKTGQGHLLSSIDKFTNLVYKIRKGPVSWFVPFIKTPMNVAKAQIEYSPLGVLTTLGASNKKEQIAKAMVGSAVYLWGATMAANHQTTWEAPTDPKEKEMFYATGRRPYSVLVPTPWGEKWVPMQYFGVTGLALAIPAAMKHFQDTSKTALTDTQIEKAVNTVGALAKYFTAQTYMQGIENFIRLSEGDIDFTTGPNLAFTAQQVEPLSGLVTYVSRVLDPIYRKASTFTEGLQRNTPLLSTKLEAYMTPEGIPSERPQDISAFGIPLRSANTLPYGLGTPDPRYEQPYKARINQEQNNAVKTKIKNDLIKNIKTGNFQNQSGGATPKLKTAGELLEQTIMGNQKEASKTGLSETSLSKLTRSKDFTYVRNLLNQSEDLGLTPELLDSELKRKGITGEEFQYDNQTLLPSDLKLGEIQNGIEGLQGNELMAKLVSYRKVSEGSRKMLLTDSVINDLVDNGTISKDIGSYLKRVQWDEKNNTFKEQPEKGRKKTSFKVSVPAARKIRTVKISGPPKSLFKPLRPQSSKGASTVIRSQYSPSTNLKIPQTQIPRIRAGVRTIKSLGKVR